MPETILPQGVIKPPDPSSDKTQPPGTTFDEINRIAAGLSPEEASGMDPDDIAQLADTEVDLGDRFIGS